MCSVVFLIPVYFLFRSKIENCLLLISGNGLGRHLLLYKLGLLKNSTSKLYNEALHLFFPE